MSTGTAAFGPVARWFGLHARGAALLGSVAGFALLVGACGSDPTATPVPPTPTSPGAPTATPAPDKEAWETEWEETIAKAKVEGELVWVAGGAATRSFARPMAEMFQQEFGIKVTLGAQTRETLAQILAEREAGLFTIDVFMAGITPGQELIAVGGLDPFPGDFILPEVKDESLWWQGRHWYGDAENQYMFLTSADVTGADLMINTDLVNPDEINSYWDVLDPKYHGLIVTQFLGQIGVLGSASEWYGRPGLGPEFLEKLVLESDITMVSDGQQGIDWVLTGQKGIGMILGSIADIVRELEAGGAPVVFLDRVLEEGAILSSGGSASTFKLLNNPPNPNARKVFVNWFLSREGQTQMQTLFPSRQSMRADIPSDMVVPEARREASVTYSFPLADSRFQTIRGEAEEFAKDLTRQWEAMQR